MAVAVEHGDLVAGGQAHDPNQVMGLVFGKHRLAPRRVETRHIEARTRHGIDSQHSRYTRGGSAFGVHSFSHSASIQHCCSGARHSASTRSSLRSAAAVSVPSTSRTTPGSTRRSRSRCRTARGSDFGELLREPRLLASVSHPNIVAITTAEKQDNVFFIVMEYVQGETLENIIALKGALELNRALDFTCQICNAVDHAHRQGVIHRDLRPANVLVTENDMLKVADFGTSRFLEIAAHGTTVIGSPPYMAPEQFHGKAVFASDIYSLGVTMYQMLTGILPYDTPAPADLDKLMSGELVTPPRMKNPALPREVNEIVMRALAPDVTARYQRAADLLAAVLAVRTAAKPRRTTGGPGARAPGYAARGGARQPPPRSSAGSATSPCTRAASAAAHSAAKPNRTGPVPHWTARRRGGGMLKSTIATVSPPRSAIGSRSS